MKSLISGTAAVLLLSMTHYSVRAEVIDAAAHGFSSSNSVVVPTDRFTAFEATVNDVAHWWSDDHTMSGFASNLYIEPEPLGCFCEKLPNGGGMVHMTVTFVNRGVMLRLTGGLGPLGLMGTNGNLTWEFAEHDSGTQITLKYAVGGYLDGGLDAVAAAVDSVLLQQLQSLKTHIEALPRD
ncbi:MAG: ATPase [Gammaproteobacteria bacterium]|nr:ATPase [Gammaproteobacteria bacterium]